MSQSAFDNDLQSVRVGLIHSLSGTMAISERPLLEAELLAIDEINKTGGILGCQIEPVIMDGASAPETFAQKAQELLSSSVKFLFGCWTSASRKAVKPIVEDAGGLLWYPVQYEGLEESEHIVYTGSCPVQQIVPAVEWVLGHIGLRIFLVGSDYVYPRTANNLIRSEVEGRKGSIVGERYVPQGGMDFASIIEEIQRQKPDAVFSTVFGESNLAFYRQYHAAGIDAQSIPIMGVCISETELQPVADVAAGHYACRNYFQSLNRPENQRFVANYKKRCGEARVCSAPMATAYTQIYLWKRVVEAAGSFDAAQVRNHVVGCEFMGPSGPIIVQPNHHTSMCAYIGRATPHGQFEVLDSTPAIRPWPWLGVEDSKLPYKAAVKEAMAAFPNVQNAVMELAASENKLRESQIWAKAVIDALQSGVVIVDAEDHVIIDANPAAVEMIGAPKEKIVGHVCHNFICPAEKGKCPVTDLRKTVDGSERVLINARGETKPILKSVREATISKKRYLIESFVDITERKHAEEALRESEQRFRRITESMTDIVAQTDLQGVCKYASPAFKTVLGYDPKDMPGKSLFDLVHPDDIDNVLEIVLKALATASTGQFEYRCRHADGHYVWLGSAGNPIFDEKGQMIGTVLSSRDITQRKQMEEVLRESEVRYRTLFDSTNDAIFIHDMGGKFLEVNRVACERLGYSREELLQMTPTDINSKEYAATLPQRIEELRKLGHSFSEIAQVRRDGTIIQTELSSRIVDYKGKPAVLSIARDITERKQVERLKDQFVSTVSHELRTPLTAIRASIGLLASGASGTLPEKGQRMLEIAVTNTDRLVRLINDILDSERLASGKTPMEKKQCSAAQLVTQAADVMKPMAEKAGISLSVDSQDAALWADPDRIAQALMNLISNAIKFSPKGGRIWVTAEPKENQMLFKVRDEGRGIPSDKLGLLFERFQQVDASDAREKGGTGLGLSISKSIVEQHSGRIWAESTIGNGSTFFFTLPLPQETEVAAQPEAMTEAQSARRVLIIEDDPDLANILATMLQRHDIQPYLALTGEKGITLSKQIRPDMIVLDLGLPDMDGSAVVQDLREDNTLRLVPLVVYTVRELNEQQRENLRLGETLFFTKSRIPPDQFEEKVVQFMKRILENRGKTNGS